MKKTKNSNKSKVPRREPLLSQTYGPLPQRLVAVVVVAVIVVVVVVVGVVVVEMCRGGLQLDALRTCSTASQCYEQGLC